MSSFIYRYPPLQPGILVKRYKRFFADIQLECGEIITAHCPNTGPMTDVSTPGSPVQVSRSDNPKRKLSYTWEMIQVQEKGMENSNITENRGTWVGINTGLPNRAIKLLLEQQLIPELADSYSKISTEVVYGSQRKSRVDFLLTGDEWQLPIYLEVKNVTWCAGSTALFPDTVTTRGQKHLRELQELIPQARSVMLYFINRSDCDRFAPGDRADPLYGKLLREAVAAGVEVLPCRFNVTPEGIRYLGLAKFE
ncbi:MAG TPA: DNA/RNA nuclease SfsA [Cyanobacteria bacterium UBA11149]|nr:DNA/RNA nuclease SfsA [Cyanobacteria bacterium UBA11367]HBE58045.1 DNA/RNA nuclease SfsA [Cyanobacteria bacterium UBA11366]HBK66250.1 DNA/RNA nuclease SfsA [Cyanobacteria bacterium UBA11166]HBR75346.1 DNA/RNA nuclease SfsA [Cyanobacteria bacterium UBA11159]HBS71939.1 DNA/RNA nuclease SfsA [Cyanobacteria bacterium UBA11153]HBW90531.1 DNA/RNA nuclease SfsA [Cyanobacteria bacterium UBA11149]HCA93920.1 DNA/RNA nuclease SfsA [Cyanobacteria bacterium UBA9226]